MCRNIKTLFNFEPPATNDEVRASALQFVRKLSGFTKPSQANQEAFDRAVDEVTAVAHRLLDSLVTNAAPRDRETEAAKARARAAERYGRAAAPRPRATSAAAKPAGKPKRAGRPKPGAPRTGASRARVTKGRSR
ncbi:MAG: DUF2277 domain-containing protein [Phycisphaerales bacterium]|nr:DUF2277 domain-containing protein [Phycisphaerales bacterium]